MITIKLFCDRIYRLKVIDKKVKKIIHSQERFTGCLNHAPHRCRQTEGNRNKKGDLFASLSRIAICVMKYHKMRPSWLKDIL